MSVEEHATGAPQATPQVVEVEVSWGCAPVLVAGAVSWALIVAGVVWMIATVTR